MKTEKSHISTAKYEASIFDAKIQVNLFSAKHASWAPSREMKSVTLSKRNGLVSRKNTYCLNVS